MVDMLSKTKIMLGIDDNSKNELLSIYIEDAEEEIKEYLNVDEIPKKAESIVRDLVVIKYNKNGSEGLESENFSGVSQSFIGGFPKDIEKRLMRLRKLPR